MCVISLVPCSDIDWSATVAMCFFVTSGVIAIVQYKRAKKLQKSEKENTENELNISLFDKR